MVELPATRYGEVRHLFSPDYPDSTMLYSVLEDHSPGKVYVDHFKAPVWAIVVCRFGGTFAGGTIDQPALNEAIDQLSAGRTILLTRAPRDRVPVDLPPGYARIIDRLEFFDRQPLRSIEKRDRTRLPDGCVIRRLDAALFERCLWRDEMVRFLGSVERFLAEGLGFALMRADEILSEAYAAFLGAGRFEIGAITPKAYRGRGYAVVTCDHLASTIEARGIETYWSCRQTNTASVATARRLGYRTERHYQWHVYQRAPTA